jgi:hypothetical protein
VRRIIHKKNAQSSDFPNDKLARWIFDTITGPGVKKRIKRDAVRPKRFPGNDGIRFDPNWQGDITAVKPTGKRDALPLS